MNKQVEFLVKLRDASQMLADASNEYIDSLAPPEAKETNNKTVTVHEINFITLKFETQQGAKLGEYEIAYKANNLEDKWRPAYNILRNSNATIKDRYHGETYAYSYWLYGEDKIYRQKLKPKPQS
ncbi:MAG TPA: hypothetical protein VLH35_01065 [Candidatus Acidoferrales bacterium]|nr:hypothetical protein [Candidatus Acidoferrales bacterium]